MGKFVASLFAAVFIFFAVFTKPVFVQATAAGSGLSSEKSPVDSERAAQVFARMEFIRCTGGFNFERWENGDFLEPVWGRFNFAPAKRIITYLEISGEVVVDETSEPLKGLPANEKGETRGYHVYVDCYDSSNNYLAYGYFYKEIMWPDDPIVVILQPASQHVSIPYSVPAGVEAENLKMALFNSNSPNGEWKADYCQKYDYCPENGGFSFWLNPVEITRYEVKDVSTGVVYSTGTLDLLVEKSVVGDLVTPINLQFSGGVVEVKFDAAEYAWEYFSNQKMDGEVQAELCPEEVPVAPIYIKVPLMTVERILTNGAGRSLFKFRATAPADTDAYVGSREFSLIAWSNGGNLEFSSVALYAYVDSNYSVPRELFDPTGMVAPSSAASVTWYTPNNEPGGYITIGASSERDGILTIPAGQTLWFDVRADISGFVPAINTCALIGINSKGLGEEVLVTAGGMCETPSVGGSGSSTPVPSEKILQSPALGTDPQCTEETIPAKVYFMDLNGGSLSVNVGGVDGNVEVLRWVPTGEMPVIAAGSNNHWGYINTATQSGYGKVVVIVTGVLQDPNGFYISFGRQPKTSRGGSDGGKG